MCWICFCDGKKISFYHTLSGGGEQEKIISTVFLASIYHSDRQKVPIKYVRYTFVMAKNVIAYPPEALGHCESPISTSIATSLG